MMKRFYLLLTLLICFGSFNNVNSQQVKNKAYTKQASLALDNDYLLGTDRYYTNGIYLSFDKLSRNQNPKVAKKIVGFELGQAIYKQFVRKVWPTVLASNMYPGGVGAIDRPITGYLYGKVKKKIFYTNNHLLQYGISVGTIGPASLGKEVQSGWHSASGVGSWWDWVWNYQLKNEAGINAHGQYAFPILKGKPGSLVNLTSVTNATLGTLFTDVSQSVVLQIGKTNSMRESSYWGSRMGHETTANNKKEIFFYYAPEIKYQVYNATVQGGMFGDDKGPITSTPERILFTNSFGLLYGTHRYTVNIGVVFLTKEAVSQRYNHGYGKIGFAYRF
jgi:lipid A 3-O-deacylase